ncbi:hypothetical protein GOEFS_028_00190 [Gordonia effusa NBRC 100432]|uniref:DoxX family protein n=1 Tax=Gordonia effusa NBRC 100432 TaxID=1077974 RepID=H0QX04_9ACTN|nr:DoxX family protein [Gordonia effusa]GAB17355.1 hypothetical protein GOEFS_028_00190 [Gordonia effusa NBRC 100432]
MTILLVVTIVCIVSTALIALPDYMPAKFVLKNSSEVGVPAAALPYLATLKLLGAAGLLVGLTVEPWIGVAAGCGLTLYFIGAVGIHVRARVLYNIAFPAAYLLLALLSTAYFIGPVADS